MTIAIRRAVRRRLWLLWAIPCTLAPHHRPLARAEEVRKANASIDCREAKPGGPEQVVLALYRDFPVDGRQVPQNQPREVLARYFDDGLVKLLLREQECVRRVEGICRIDVDPRYDAQDVDIDDFRVCAADSKRELVSVRFRNLGKETVVTYRIRKTHRSWRIGDVLYTSGPSLAQLLSQPEPG